MQYLLSNSRPLIFFLAAIPLLSYFEDDRMAVYRKIFSSSDKPGSSDLESLLSHIPPGDFVTVGQMVASYPPKDEKELDVRVRKILIPLVISRENCSRGIEMIDRLLANCPVPFTNSQIIALVGALIRMSSDRELGLGEELLWNIIAIFEKYPVQTKPFFPQLLRVMIVGLEHSAENSGALRGLELLLKHSPRPELILTELCKYCCSGVAVSKIRAVLKLLSDWKLKNTEPSFDFGSLQQIQAVDPDAVHFLLH